VIRYLWLIPLLPFAGFAANGLLGARLGRRFVTVVGCGTVLLAFLASVGAVADLAFNLAAYEGAASSGVKVSLEHRRADLTVWEWVPAAGAGGGPRTVAVPWLLTLDPLSGVMLLVVTGVGFLIHVYSTAYMGEDPGYFRFFAYLNLFMASMLTLVLGGAFPVMFVGWEGVGLCSYLLIGFWYEKEENAQAGRKAFITNRIGDAGFILGMLLLWGAFGTFEMGAILDAVRGGHAGVAPGLLTGAAVLLFVGACGKSAQLPLYVWLPDAMAGPTPVSALIHAATMVTAGVYLVCRCAVLFAAAPYALTVVAWVGGLTALFAATMGLAQDDIKKVLAYSTVSQLGYMFVGAGVGAYTGAIFHLTTHAFFKALLFLGAGAVIHALHHEQDLWKMGNLKTRLPWTHASLFLGWLAIAGIPPWAGFFSKDEILVGAYGASKGLWGMGLVGAALTALYMTRLMGLAFWGQSRVDPHVEGKIHEPPRAMTWVLVALAGLATVGGGLGLPVGKHLMRDWLAPSFAGTEAAAAHAGEAAGHAAAGGHHVSGWLEVGLMGASVAAAVVGIGVGLWFYRKGRGERAEAAARKARWAYRILKGKYFVDELYDATVLRAYYALCRFFNGVDTHAVDGVVNRTGDVFEASAGILKLFHTGLVRNYALFFLLGAAAVVWALLL
jgi:NADH-quinone oxidoreductase subunit L